MGVSSQRIKVIALMIGALILFLFAVYLIRSLPEKVDASFRAHDDVPAYPEVMLNHANTYYWWGRYRKNTLPEFDTAAKMATQALLLAKARLKIDGDTARFHVLERQAKKIITLAREQAEICRYNLSTYVPAYMEIMGHDQAYMQEDADGQDVPFIALRGAIGRLTELLSPNRNQTIGSLSHFTLLNVNTNNPLAEEMLVQELNNSTRMYTIPSHELSRIVGLDSVRVTDLLGDSTVMARIANAYNTDELAVIDFQENDRVNGIYYYGMRLRFWNVEKGWQSRNVYTEFMTRDRVFNQISGLILPLLLAFLLTAFALNLFLNSLVNGGKSWSSVSLIHLPLSFLLATIVQFALVKLILKNFLNPAPEDYFVSDGGELWVIAYPLTFILPAFITYLILGKMDSFIPRFHSDLENPAVLFTIVSGTLLTIPCVFTYYQVIRFGTGLELTFILTLIGLLTALSFFVARHWASIINFPTRVHLAHRMSTWLALIAYVWLVFSLLSDLQLHYDPSHLRDWIWGSLTPVLVIAEPVHILIKRFIRPRLQKRSQDVKAPAPVGLDEFILTASHHGQFITDRSTGRVAASLYVKSERGMPVGAAVESQYSMKERDSSIRIDFSDSHTNQEVHYPAYADAFEYYLPSVKFNTATETARKTSNLLGKLLSAVSSVGGVMIDERPAEGRNPAELAQLLLDIPWPKPGIWFFDHVEDMQEEDIVLLEHIIREVKDRRTILALSKGSDKDNPPLPLLICCGYGEFGLRDRLFAALASLEGEGLSGVHVYSVKYDQPAKMMLEQEDFPIQLRLHLESLFRQERRDHTPGFITETLNKLRRNGNFLHDPTMPFTLAALDQMNKLPDIDGAQSLSGLSKLQSQLQQVLIAAAYIADENGHFYMPVLTYIVKMDRMPLLQLLKESEKQNLVYDLKGIDHFYWYAFTDRTIIAGLKRIDNPGQEQVSQIAYECYRGYVEYHLAELYDSDVLNKLLHAHKQGFHSTDSIMLLASRSYMVRPIFPWLVFKINHAAALILSEPGLARYEEALKCIERAFDLMSINEVQNQPETGKMFFDVQKLRFKLWLETGRVHNPDAEQWLDEIRGNDHFMRQSEDDRTRFLLIEIRFRFTRFSSKHNDESKGKALCESLLASIMSEEQRRCVRFYLIKLIPVRLYSPGTNGWDTEAIRVHRLYRELLTELENDHISTKENRELYRQVLNDYGGSFLGDKILPLTLQMNHSEDVKLLLAEIGMETHESLLDEVESLLFKRLALELLNIGEDNITQVPIDKDQMMKLLMNEDPLIDKRGICYTLNYLSRAYLTCGLHMQCVETGELAYRFNTLVGDKTGSCLSAGTIAFAYEQLAESEKAYAWFECSFGHGWETGHWSTPTLALHMYRMATAASDPFLSRRSEAYLRQIAIRAVITYFPSKSISNALAHKLMSSHVLLQKQVPNGLVDPFLGTSLESFIDKANPNSFEYWKDQILKKSVGKGSDTARWLMDEHKTFNWESTFGQNVRNGIESMKLILSPSDADKKYEFNLYRAVGAENWFICSLTISK